MKVIDVAEHYAPSGGGVKTYVNNKIDAAQANGVRMIILAPGQEDKIEYLSLIHISEPTRPY